jgi:CRP-like cAMP-binding protein
MKSIKHELRDLPLFRGINGSELALVAQQLTRLSIRSGKVLVQEGTIGREFMIIVEGQAEVRQNGRLIATIGAGELVGEMALLSESGRGKRNATVTAATDLVIYVGSPFEFRQMIHAAPAIAEKVHEIAASRASEAA